MHKLIIYFMGMQKLVSEQYMKHTDLRDPKKNLRDLKTEQEWSGTEPGVRFPCILSAVSFSTSLLS